MTVTGVVKDPVALTMTVSAEFAATPERVWRLWKDPRQLERWWGPPGYPATFVEHSLHPGATSKYYMTSPDGEQFWGFWRVTKVDEPALLEVEDGFADDQGNPNPDMPVGAMRVIITAAGDRTRMEIVNGFPSTEAMEQLLTMGQEEGMVAALGQIEGLLAED